jgi:two-component system, cell cycle response regulator DivK
MLDRRRPRKPPERPLVLIVDRHQDTRELYAVALPPLGFDVMTVADCADAYRQAWGSRPDLIVSDVTLRHRDGWELLRDLKGDPRTRDIPVVVVTADGQPPVRARAACEACVAFIVKPCLPEDLALELRQVLVRQTSHEPASART